MATVTRYPTTNAAGDTGFSSAGSAYASDDTYAFASPGVNSTISSYYGGFDFASYIPSGATITSVVVKCERRFSTTASSASSTLRPYNGTSALASENENTSEPTTDTEYQVDFGALATADVRSSDFRILVGARRGSGASGYTYYLDVVYVTVTYTSGYTLTCDQGSVSLAGQDVTLKRAELLGCDYGSISLAGQDVTLTYSPVVGYSLACDHASLALEGQIAALLAARWLVMGDSSSERFYVLVQTITLTYTPTGTYSLEAEYFTVTLSGQDVLFVSGLNLACTYAAYTLSLKSANLFYGLWEPSGDMITFGTLLTRIQNALGDPNGTTWDRTEVIWPFAVDAIRDFPILRPKSIAHTITEAGHSFALPADFRKVIYVEFPLYQDPPEYLARKPHLGGLFYGEDGFYDVDRDYDEGEGYIMWISNSLAVDDVLTVRYLAAHTTEFANEYSYITIENQYVQVLITHVVMMCYQERLSLQLQDPTAHTSTIQQMTEAVKTAEINYQDQINRALEDVSSSPRVEGWKVDKHDRIY